MKYDITAIEELCKSCVMYHSSPSTLNEVSLLVVCTS